MAKGHDEKNEFNQSSQVDSGLAVTHEQERDVFTAGTIDGIFQREGEEMEIPPEGYDQ
jgi:hypothetical protein